VIEEAYETLGEIRQQKSAAKGGSVQPEDPPDPK
jgi:hypothetical protein